MSSDTDMLEFLYGIPVGVCQFDKTGRIDIANPKIAQIFMPVGGPGAMISIHDFLAVAAPDLAEFIKAHDSGPGVVVDGEELRIEPEQMFAKGGKALVISITVTALSCGKFLASVTDLTSERERELIRVRTEARLRAVIDNIVDYAIFSIDLNGRIDTWNRSGERLFGRTEAETVETDLSQIIPIASFKEPDFDAVLNASRQRGWADIEGEVPRGNGGSFWGEGLIAPLIVEDRVAGYSVILRDATENRRAREALEKAANTDPLTGLYNRRAFFAMGQKHLAQRRDRPTAILMVDIDHFKQVNDTYGHDYGDLVIVEVARRLSDFSRSGDVLCRFGGEEFLALLPDTDSEAAKRLAEELRAAVQQVGLLASDGSPLTVTISGGWEVIAPGAGFEPGMLDEAIKSADGHLYEAKMLGRNRMVGPTTAGHAENLIRSVIS